MPRWRSTARMTPPWATARTCSAGVGAVQVEEGVEDAADDGLVELEARRAAAVVEPARPLGLDLGAREAGPLARRRARGGAASVSTGPTPMCSAMSDAVVQARWRSLATIADTGADGAGGRPACSCRAAESGGSAWPCQRPSAFQADWPWRTSRTRVGSRGSPDTAATVADPLPPRRAARPAQADSLGRTSSLWPSSACSPRPGKRRARTVTRWTAATVGEALAVAVARYGAAFAARAATCKVWVNGEPADPATPVGERDEVAVLPPVSGG